MARTPPRSRRRFPASLRVRCLLIDMKATQTNTMNNVTSDNRFLKVLIAAQRAVQIHKGARPLIRIANTRATRIALEEVDRGLISFEFITTPELKSERDNRDAGGNDGVEVNREGANQLSVSRVLSAGRPSD